MYNKMLSDLVVRGLIGQWIRVHDVDEEFEGFHRIVDVMANDPTLDCGLIVVLDFGDGREEGLPLEWHYAKFDLLPHAPVENLIEGRWTSHDDRLHLFVDGDEILVRESQKVWNHGNGFAVGYPGSGPAQTALAILLAVTSDPELSARAHQNFKEAFLVRLPQAQDFTLRVNVHRWLEGAGYV